MGGRLTGGARRGLKKPDSDGVRGDVSVAQAVSSLELGNVGGVVGFARGGGVWRPPGVLAGNSRVEMIYDAPLFGGPND